MTQYKDDRIQQLEKRIEDLQRQKEMLERWGDSIYSLDDFSEEMKVLAFDRLYRHARGYLRSYIEDGYEPKDGVHYLYEAVVEATLGKSVWDIINSIGG